LFRWDVRRLEEIEVNRPEWYGTKVRISPITGKNELYYPKKIQRMKIAASFGSVGVSVLIILLSILGIITYTAWASNYFGTCSFPQLEENNCISGNQSGNHSQCTDPCYTRPTQTNCESLTFIYSDSNINYCFWNSTSNSCVPNCLGFIRKQTCDENLFGTEFREACLWRDTYYISSITAAIINLIVIVSLAKVFETLAQKFNDWENHQTQTQYENSLIIKHFFFQFLNSYTILFYIAFFKGSTANAIFGRQDLSDSCLFGSCFNELMIQLVIVFVGKQVVNQIQELGIPVAKKIFRRKLEERKVEKIKKKHLKKMEKLQKEGKITKITEEQKQPPQWVLDGYLDEFGNVLFDDYNELAIQFGFITLFVAAFPLAPLFALWNNLIEIRTDSWKILTSYQRPPGLQAKNLGILFYFYYFYFFIFFLLFSFDFKF